MRVAVHWNFHKNLFSVVGPEGRVIEHAEEFALENVKFCVGQRGNERVRQAQVKNVHARIRGQRAESPQSTRGWRLIKYDPYRWTSFVTASDERGVASAEELVGRVVDGRARVFARGLSYL
jgi:hypothetical protein